VSSGFARDLIDDAQLIQRYLKAVAIDVELEIPEGGAYFATTSFDFGDRAAALWLDPWASSEPRNTRSPRPAWGL
jgi:ABC-type transport system substrate-binding protein